MTKTFNIELDESTATRLAALAELRDRSPQTLITAAILEYIEREGRYEREKAVDQARWARYQLTGEAMPHEQVTNWLAKITADGSLS